MVQFQNVFTGEWLTIEVGDTVDFKADIEGQGKVVEIIAERGWNGTFYTFLVQDTEHPAARRRPGYNFPVVLVDSDHIWPLAKATKSTTKSRKSKH